MCHICSNKEVLITMAKFKAKKQIETMFSLLQTIDAIELCVEYDHTHYFCCNNLVLLQIP